MSFLWIDEQLRIDHYRNLFTIYRYLLTRIADGTSATTHDATAEVNYSFYRNLVNDLQAEGRYETLTGGRMMMFAGQSSPSYQRMLPWGGNFSLAVGGRYEIDDNKLAGGQVSIMDESHTAPTILSATLGFTLNNPFAITATIVMVDNRGGARIPTTLNVDYQIVPEGNLTEIIPLPTSPVIQPGDPLLVSYTYQVAPSARYSTTSHWANVGVHYPWFELSFEHDDFRQSLLSGRDSSFLQSRTSNIADLELIGKWGPLDGRASGAYEIMSSSTLSYTRKRLGQHVSYRAPWEIMVGIDADESWTDFTLPVRQSQSRGLRVSADRYVWNGGFTSLFAGIRTMQDSEVPTEDYRELGVRAQWVLGKLQFAPTFLWTDRSWGKVKTNDLRVELRIIRRFDRGY